MNPSEAHPRTCACCQADLAHAYHLQLCDGCLAASGAPQTGSRVERRFMIFKVVAPLVALAYLPTLLGGSVELPFGLVPLAVSWAMVSVFLTGVVHLLAHRLK